MSEAAADIRAKDLFHFCTRCGAARAATAGGAHPFRCASCGFTYYFNPACAVAVIIEDGNGRVLFIRRGREPARGKLAMVGGFADPGETGEEAARREVREEVGLELAGIEYVGAWPNVYRAGGFVVDVLDIFYHARLATTAMTLDPAEVSSAEWQDPRSVAPEEIAFPSMRAALAEYLARRGGAGEERG